MKNNIDKKAYSKKGTVKKNTILSNRAIKESLIRYVEEFENMPQLRRENKVLNKIVHLVKLLHQEFETTPHKYKKNFNMRVELNQPRTLKSPRVIFKFGSGADGQKRISKTVGRIEDVWLTLVTLAKQESDAMTFKVLPKTAVNDVLAMYDSTNPNVPIKRQNPARRKPILNPKDNISIFV